MGQGSMVQNSCSVIYLHGFASGPASTKAKFFASELLALGLDVRVPDLNRPSFETLTLSSQLSVIDETIAALPNKEFVLIGSSMGGLLSTIKSKSLDQVRALILLAPGFGLPRRWQNLFGSDGLERWKRERTMNVYHYGVEKELPLSYNFVTDAATFQTDGLSITVPTLVFHGKNDVTVPVEESISFAQNNPELVELVILDDDHQLISSLPTIWSKSFEFLCQHGIVRNRIALQNYPEISERC